MKRLILSLLVAACCWVHTTESADDARGMKVVYGEQRVALIIGNGSYKSSPLANPVNDATDIAKVLREREFRVTLLTNATKRQMVDAVREFGKDIKRGGVGLFYYAGHGMQIDGRNYLIPIGAEVKSEKDVEFEGLDAGRVLSEMEDAGNRLNLVILDACRDNPFARSFRSTTKGLAKMDAPMGTLVAYATGPGQTAADGTGSTNGVYTSCLLSLMTEPGLEIGLMFRRVRQLVLDMTNKQQIPWELSSLMGDFYFTPLGEGVTMKDEITPNSMQLSKAEEEMRQKLIADKTAELKALDARIAEKQKGINEMPNPVKEVPLKAQPGKAITIDLGSGVMMDLVWVPNGEFMMGSPAGETDRFESETQHKVTLTEGFWMGKYEVTQGQYKQIMGSNPSKFTESGKDAPVETVSWDNAKEFCGKVTSLMRRTNNKQLATGGECRLPTEAEWEYACRAGTRTRYYTGDSESDLGRAGWYVSNSGSKTHEVGQKTPNAWGLYDMHGNVYEWCEDWYGEYSGGSISDPKGASSGSSRVLRGGSWFNLAGSCRSAPRSDRDPERRYNFSGFRVVLAP